MIILNVKNNILYFFKCESINRLLINLQSLVFVINNKILALYGPFLQNKFFCVIKLLYTLFSTLFDMVPN